MKFTWGRAVDEPVEVPLLVWGRSGTGKTATLVRAAADMDLSFEDIAYGRAKPVGDPSVFLLTFERNARATARVINPVCGVKLCETKGAAWEVIEAAIAGELVQEGFTRLAVDGLTALQLLIADELTVGSDDYWTQLVPRTRMLLRTLRSIPMTVIASALEQERVNEKTKVVHVAPQFESRNIPESAMSMQSACGRTTKIGEGVNQQYVVDFNLSNRYAVKDVGALRGRVKPCAAAWLEVLAGARDPATIRVNVPLESEAVLPPPDAAAAPAAPEVRKIAR